MNASCLCIPERCCDSAANHSHLFILTTFQPSGFTVIHIYAQTGVPTAWLPQTWEYLCQCSTADTERVSPAHSGLRSAPVGAKRVPLAHSGLRSAPVGAKRVPLAHSGLRSAPVGAKRVPLAHSGLRSAPVGAKRVPLAHSAPRDNEWLNCNLYYKIFFLLSCNLSLFLCKIMT